MSNQGQQIRRNVWYYSFKILCHPKKVKLLTMRLLKLLYCLLDVHNKMHITCFMFFFHFIKAKTFDTCLASKREIIFWKLSAITTKHSISFVTNHNVLMGNNMQKEQCIRQRLHKDSCIPLFLAPITMRSSRTCKTCDNEHFFRLSNSCTSNLLLIHLSSWIPNWNSRGGSYILYFTTAQKINKL